MLMLLARVFYEPIIPTLLECVLSFPVEQDMYHNSRAQWKGGQTTWVRTHGNRAVWQRRIGRQEDQRVIALSHRHRKSLAHGVPDIWMSCRIATLRLKVSSAYAPHMYTAQLRPRLESCTCYSLKFVMCWLEDLGLVSRTKN